MATDVRQRATSPQPSIEALLARLRARIRAYITLDALAAVAIVVAGAFWLSLAVDWVFELPRWFRGALLLTFATALGYLIYRLLIARLLVRLTDRSMALLIERRFGQFRDSLLTSVELAESADHAKIYNPAMLEHTRHAALARTGDVKIGDVFKTGPLVRRLTLAMVLVASAAAFAVAAPGATSVWVRRNLLFSQELWPRTTHLSVDGFADGNRVKIARGADWVLAVKADASTGREIPEVVEVRYSTADGARGRENMVREGIVVAGQAPFQNYSHAFKSVLSPLEFQVRGGDDRVGPYYLDVVESPTISRMTLHCEYPAYMHRDPRDVPVAGVMQLPLGTKVAIHAEANKPLVAAEVTDVPREGTPQTARLEIAAEGGAPSARFDHQLAALEEDKVLLFTLFDADGIRSLEAVRLAIAAVADEPPQVNVQLSGIGTAITPAARLPVAGEVADDYGVAKMWFEFHPDDAAAQQQTLASAPEGREKVSAADALETGPLALQPKQKLHFAVQAADGCDLAGGPHVGTSQRYVLDVVTPEQLRAMLEARELLLRRRFETIVEEFTDTRNLLAGTEAADPAKAAAPPAAGAEPATSPEAVHLARVTQNVERSRHETLGVAEAFDEIRAEMINNRVDTEELKIRLKEGVADPLRRIISDRFPGLEEQLKKLSAQLADPAASAPTKTAALASMDAILVEMRMVLDKMMELETFNEVLDMLREIIAEQEKVNAETKARQKDKLRDLTE